MACGAPDANEDTLASSDAVVDGDTFGRASAIVRGIDYLPFEYKADGCYARALYMGMELAAEWIESNAIFVFATDKANELRIPGTNWTWNYHVAPMLQVGRESEWKVLDLRSRARRSTGSRGSGRWASARSTVPSRTWSPPRARSFSRRARSALLGRPSTSRHACTPAQALATSSTSNGGISSNVSTTSRRCSFCCAMSCSLAYTVDRTSELVSRLASRRKLNGPPRDIWTRCEACVMEEGSNGLELGSGCTAR